MDKRPQRLAKNTTDLMPKNASCKRWDTLVCSSSILAATLDDAASFSSPWRGKRRVFEQRKPFLTDQLQPSTNSDKLSVRFNGLPLLPVKYQPHANLEHLGPTRQVRRRISPWPHEPVLDP
jgi:hypothetical protein